MNKEWSEKNKKMQSLIGKKESFEDGIAVLRKQDRSGQKMTGRFLSEHIY